jgi:hypothetical protein
VDTTVVHETTTNATNTTAKDAALTSVTQNASLTNIENVWLEYDTLVKLSCRDLNSMLKKKKLTTFGNKHILICRLLGISPLQISDKTKNKRVHSKYTCINTNLAPIVSIVQQAPLTQSKTVSVINSLSMMDSLITLIRPVSVTTKLKASDIVAQTSLKVDERFRVEGIWKSTDDKSTQITNVNNIPITNGDICTLQMDTRLNDNIINSMMILIQQQANQLGHNIYATSSHFYTLLVQKGGVDIERARRWFAGAKIKLNELDKIIVPIHGMDHWTLAVINIRDNQFEYYDSNNYNSNCIESGQNVLNNLRICYDQITDQTQTEISEWKFKIYSSHQIPQQVLYSLDCGVFVCTFASCIAIDAPVTEIAWRQMYDLRIHIAISILRGSLSIFRL